MARRPDGQAPFDLQGHRGARALAPENTLAGFRRALALGVDTIELDIAVTADLIPVISHDPALNPDITRGPGGAWLDRSGPLIATLTLDQLRGFDVGRIRPGSAYAQRFPRQQPADGARIPTLAEALALDPAVRFNIELKLMPEHRDWTVAPQQMAELVLAVVDAAGAVSRVTIQSFDWRPMQQLARLRPEVALGFLTEPATVAAVELWWGVGLRDRSVPQAVAEAAAGAAGRVTWTADHESLTPELLQEAHALGLRVLPWTVNEPADMARLIGWGVDGLITDAPDVALPLLGRDA